MDKTINLIKENKYVLAGSAAVLLATGAYVKLNSKKETMVFEKDVVYIGDFEGKNKDLPSYSPYVLKVISILEYNNIKYQVVTGFNKLGPNPRGTFPFIRYNDELIYDSYFIIEWIFQTFKQVQGKMELSISDDIEKQAINHITQRFVDESVTHFSGYSRWVLPEFSSQIVPRMLNSIENPIIKSLITRVATSGAIKKYNAHGIGKLSLEEVKSVSRADFNALSNLLAGKKFLFGDYISNADISLFSALAQIYYVPVDTPIRLLLLEKQNLVNYVENTKKTIFSDAKWELLKQ